MQPILSFIMMPSIQSTQVPEKSTHRRQYEANVQPKLFLYFQGLQVEQQIESCIS